MRAVSLRKQIHKEEAKAILAKEMEIYRQRPYNDLQCILNTQDTADIEASSGVVYQLEFQAMWDDKEGGILRILKAIDDGGFRAFVPLTKDFILSPDGPFVHE